MKLNFKVLAKAMSFMFLPTLGVLIMLLVGFFDPMEMWNWVKSDSVGAILIRLLITLLEIGLVVYMYNVYMDEETLKSVKNGNTDMSKGREYRYNNELCEIFNKSRSTGRYFLHPTESENIKIIEFKNN